MPEIEQDADNTIQMTQPPHPPPLPPQTPNEPSAEPSQPLWPFRRGVHQILVTLHGDFVSFQHVYHNEPKLESRRKSAFGPEVHQLCVTVDVEHFASEDIDDDDKAIPGPPRMWVAKQGVHQLLVTLDGEQFVAYQNVYDNQQISGKEQITAPGLDVYRLLITVDGEDFITHKTNVHENESISGWSSQPVPKPPPMPKPKEQEKPKDLKKRKKEEKKKYDEKKKDEKKEGGPYRAPTYAYAYAPWRHPPSRPPVLSPPAPPPLPWKRTGLRRPSTFYLWEEQREKYVNICVPLYNATLKGNWHAAEAIINDHPEVINMSITKRQDTVLHIAASTKHTHFAQKLVNMMEVKDLELQNRDEETALCVAVASTVEMVDVLLKRNNRLLKIRKNGDLPFVCAIFFGNKDMVRHIYFKTNLVDESWTYSDKKRILDSCVAFGLLDIAVEIYTKYKEKQIPTIDTLALASLAYNPSAFDGTVQPVIKTLENTSDSKAAELLRIMLGEIVKKEKILNEISGKSERKGVEGLQFAAARLGNYKFIIEFLRLCPDLTWEMDNNKHTIFHIAVLHRQENVYNLLYELGSKKLATTDKHKNNILHLAAKMPAQSRLNIVSGSALQMQREVMWFKEVQTRLNSIDRIKANDEGMTPRELFTHEHAGLMAMGEGWMKHTSAHCMVVAALIATIMFAAAFALPGGYDQTSGRPIHMKKSAFIVFVVTDAVSLFTSSASLLMFLAILTARYTETDFLVSLPVKLMVGLLTLFISIATMMIAFSASFLLLYNKSTKWIPILVSVLAGLPVILFAALQYPLLIDVIRTILNSRHLFRPKNRMLY